MIFFTYFFMIYENIIYENWNTNRKKYYFSFFFINQLEIYTFLSEIIHIV